MNVMDVKWGVLSAFTVSSRSRISTSLSRPPPWLWNTGQTNYSAAHSVVDGFLDKLPNSFSIVIPAVSDLGYFARMSESSPALANFLSWPTTSQHTYLPVSQ